MEKHAAGVCSMGFHTLRQLRRVRRSLDTDAIRGVHPPNSHDTTFLPPFPLYFPFLLSLPLLSLPSPLPCPSFPSFLPLEVSPLNPARGLGERRVWGGAPAEIEMVHFSFKICHLGAAISVIFMRINLSNFVQFKQYQGKSGPRRTTRYFVQSKIFQFLPRCMECRRCLAMRILSVRLSVRPSHA